MTDAPDVGFPLDTYQVVFLTRGPKAADMDEETVERLGGEHIRYNVENKAAGKVLGAGMIVGASDTRNTATGHPVVGLGFYDRPPDEVRAIKDADPGVRAGLYAAEMVTWYTPKGAVTFHYGDAALAGPPAADVDAIRMAYREFLDLAEEGGFGAPPPGEWDAEHLLAHIAAGHAAIASTALAVASGQRPSYDNRPSLDEQNLRRVIASAGGLAGLVALVRRGGELFGEVAAQLTEADLAVSVPVLIVSNDEVVVDEPRPLRFLVEGVAHVHLPRHADQLRSLR